VGPREPSRGESAADELEAPRVPSARTRRNARYLPAWNPGNHFTFAKSSANVTRNRSAEVAFLCMSIFTSFLEPEVLESFGSAAVELRGHTVVAEPRREVALGDPDRGLVAG